MDTVELTSAEAAQALSYHRNTVLRLAKAGKFKNSRLADDVRSKGYVIPDYAVLERAKSGKAGQVLKAEAVIAAVRERRINEAAAVKEAMTKPTQ